MLNASLLVGHRAPKCSGLALAVSPHLTLPRGGNESNACRGHSYHPNQSTHGKVNYMLRALTLRKTQFRPAAYFLFVSGSAPFIFFAMLLRCCMCL